MKSVSRLRGDVTPKDVVAAGRKLVRLLASYQRVEDMINIGAYAPGSNPEIDESLRMVGPIKEFLRQVVEEQQDLETTFEQLKVLAGQ